MKKTITQKRLERKLKKLEEVRDNLAKEQRVINQRILAGSTEGTMAQWRRQWQQYYQACRSEDNPCYQVYLDMKQAYFERPRNMQKVRAIAEMARGMMQNNSFLTEPTCPDPFAMDGVANQYIVKIKDIDGQIRGVNEELEDYAPEDGIAYGGIL